MPRASSRLAPRLAATLAIGLTFSSVAVTQAQSPAAWELPPEAARQIEALLAEKAQA